jgi:hypothetical protein
MNRDSTRILINHFSQDQSMSAYSKTIPPHVASKVNCFVGDNDLGTCNELLAIASKAQDGKWLQFFEEFLKPEAEKGLLDVLCPTTTLKKHFSGMNWVAIETMFKRKGVSIGPYYNSPNEYDLYEELSNQRNTGPFMQQVPFAQMGLPIGMGDTNFSSAGQLTYKISWQPQQHVVQSQEGRAATMTFTGIDIRR